MATAAWRQFFVATLVSFRIWATMELCLELVLEANPNSH
jgi:hypothetical protein